MRAERDETRTVILQALSGRGAHVLARDALDGLDWELAGVRSADGEHTIFASFNHLVYWHDFAVAGLDGDKPATPEHAADSWPGDGAPTGAGEWADAERRFLAGLTALEARAAELDLFASSEGKSALEILQLVASHNSYHLGQIVLLRRALGAWPPPGGGATW